MNIFQNLILLRDLPIIFLSLVKASLWEPSLSSLSGHAISFNHYRAREFFLCHSRELASGNGCFLPLYGSSLRCGLVCSSVLFFLSRHTISFNCYHAREIFSAILLSFASGSGCFFASMWILAAIWVRLPSMWGCVYWMLVGLRPCIKIPVWIWESPICKFFMLLIYICCYW